VQTCLGLIELTTRKARWLSGAGRRILI